MKKWRDPIIIFQVIALTRTLKKQDGPHSLVFDLIRKRTMPIDSQTPKTYARFQGNSEKKNYGWEAENLIMSSPYSWVNSHKKIFLKILRTQEFIRIFDLDL